MVGAGPDWTDELSPLDAALHLRSAWRKMALLHLECSDLATPLPPSLTSDESRVVAGFRNI